MQAVEEAQQSVQAAQQTVQAAQQTYWAQLHEAQQKVQEADNEMIANEDRRSTTRVGDMTPTDEDLGKLRELEALAR